MTKGGQETPIPARKSLTCYSWTRTPKGRVVSSPRESWLREHIKEAHRLYRNEDTALLGEAPLGGCLWSVKGKQDQVCMGESQAGPDTSPQECGGDRQGRGSLRARGLLRGWVSAALHEVCAWHRVWRLPTLQGSAGQGLERLSSPRSIQESWHTSLGKGGDWGDWLWL